MSNKNPTHEQDAILTINGQHIHVSVEWEAKYQHGYPGNREEPAERAGYEIKWSGIKTPADWEDRLAEITEDLERG